MIIWRGFGFLVAVFIILGYGAARYTAEHLWGNPLPVGTRQGAELIGMLLAAALVYGLHFALERSDKPRTVIDKETKQEIVLRSKHDLFFIPVKYWPYVLAGLGLLFFFQS
jgi:hypothetical protein